MNRLKMKTIAAVANATTSAPTDQQTAGEVEPEDEFEEELGFVYTPSLDSPDPTAEAITLEQQKRPQPKDYELTMPTFDLTPRQQQDIRDAFSSFDLNGTGIMESAELPVALTALGFELPPKQLKTLLAKLDPNNSGVLCFSDFLAGIKVKLAEKEGRKDLKKAFKLFDLDKTGSISYENIRTVAYLLGEDMNDEESQEMITEADVNLDGEVDFDEFVRIVTKINIYY